jgi:hypothetical protein
MAPFAQGGQALPVHRGGSMVTQSSCVWLSQEVMKLASRMVKLSICGVFILTLLLTSFVEAQDSTAKLRFEVTDQSGRQVPCRIHLSKNGKPHKVDQFPYWRDHFVCPGKAEISTGAGHYKWEIERGPEFERKQGQATLAPTDETIVKVVIKRIANLRNEGWVSGDLHVHRSIDDVELLMQAEQIDFAPVITWWNSRNLWRSKQLPQETTKRFDGHRLYTVMAGEDEREGGALLYFGLTRPLNLTAKSREFPSPMKFVGEALQRDKTVWIDIEKPFWWDVPVWLASGRMNSVGLANNHMCRSTVYSSEAWGKARDEIRLPKPLGNGYWTQELYYHILNSGLRLPPSAGSASGVLPNPVGYNRVYVQLKKSERKSNENSEPSFTSGEWFAALAKGRCFVTNGPLLRVTVNAKPAGSILKIKNQQLAVKFDVQLTSLDRVPKLEVIHNGKVIHEVACSKELHQRKKFSLTVKTPGWFLVRAITDNDKTFRFASTAAWYVESDKVKHHISKASAQFFLDWIDERISRIQSNVTDANESRSVLEPHEKARLFWQQKVRSANAE